MPTAKVYSARTDTETCMSNLSRQCTVLITFAEAKRDHGPPFFKNPHLEEIVTALHLTNSHLEEIATALHLTNFHLEEIAMAIHLTSLLHLEEIAMVLLS